MSGALIDDVALAAAVKRGGRIWLGHAALARSVRPYPRVPDIWRMVARTAYVQLRFSPLLLLADDARDGADLPGAAGGGAVRSWRGTLVGLAGLGRDGGRVSPDAASLSAARALWAPCLPLVAAFYLAATIGSAVNHHLGRGVAWKGRAYQGAGA